MITALRNWTNKWMLFVTTLLLYSCRICNGLLEHHENLIYNSREGIYDRLNKEWTKNYDRRIRPYSQEKPLDIEVSIYILTIRSVSEVTMDYQLELYFREYWKDPRLAYSRKRFNNISQISLHESLAELLWVSDTFLPNAIYTNNPNSNSVSHRSLLRLKPDGHLLYSRRLSVTAECPMDLSLYPFDQQLCRLSIESYGNDINEINYQWSKLDPVTINERLELPDFKLKKILTRTRNITLATGTYSRLECCFFFVRNSGFYFVQLFIPATAIVVTSWLSLWMEKESTFSDMIQVILTITFLYYSYNTVMPKVSYIKAMDIYLGTCFIFVFLSLIKLAILKYLKILSATKTEQSRSQQKFINSRRRRIFEKQLQPKMPVLSNGTSSLKSLEYFSKDEYLRKNGHLCYIKLKLKRKGKLVDFGSDYSNATEKFSYFFRSLSLWLFPSMFVGFCTFYFFVYFRYSEEGEDDRCVFGI